jgi:hypothetical protein
VFTKGRALLKGVGLWSLPGSTLNSPELRQAAPFKALFEALEIEQDRRGNL